MGVGRLTGEVEGALCPEAGDVWWFAAATGERTKPPGTSQAPMMTGADYPARKQGCAGGSGLTQGEELRNSVSIHSTSTIFSHRTGIDCCGCTRNFQELILGQLRNCRFPN